MFRVWISPGWQGWKPVHILSKLIWYLQYCVSFIIAIINSVDELQKVGLT